MKVSVILYLRKIVKNRIQDKSLSREYAIEILKYFVDVVLTSNLSDTSLQNLTLSLQDLLNFRLVSENKQITNDLIDLLANYLQNNVGVNVLNYKSIIILLENIMLSSSVSHQNVNDILQKTLSMGEYMLSNILSLFSKLESIQNVTVFLSYVDICKLVFQFLYSTVVKMRSRLNILQNVLEIFNQKFVATASQLVMMTIPGLLEPHYVAFKGDSEFDNSINVMKSKVLQFLNVLIGQQKGKIEDPNLVKVYSTLIQSTIENLDFLVSNKFSYIKEMSKDSTTYPDYGYEHFIYQMILFLGRIIIKSPFMESFNEYSKNFAKIIILPLLISSKNELEKMKEDGEEYSNYISDVIDDHKSKTIKSVTAFLLQNMCDKYDGFTTYIVNYCIQLVDFGVRGCDVNILPNYNLLTSTDRIFSLSSLEYQIETSILVFCIATSSIFKQENIQKNLKGLFDTHLNALFAVNSDIIKNRLSLFLGIYMDSIYSPEDTQFGYCLEYLFINLFYYKTNQGVAHQAADSLNDIIGVKKFQKSIKDVIGKYFAQLIDNIKDIKIGLYFDVMLEIVMNINVDDYIVGLTQELTARVLKEIAPYTRIKFRVTSEDGTQSSTRREKDSQYNIVVNKCFNIIRTISDKEEYVQKYILQLEEILDPIFEHMKNPTKIDFDEDIVLIMTSFIKHLKYIPKSGLKILVELPKYLKKSKGLLLDLYELVNQYIVYGKKIIDTKEDYNKIIMKIFRASFDKKSDYDKSPFLGASLMQIWLENSNEIPETLVKEIILVSIDQIKSIANGYQDKEEFEESTDLYTFVALLVVVYSGFINYPIVTFEALISNNDVHFFIKWSEELVTLKFYSSYLTKSIIIGMCAFLRNEHLMRQIPEYINKFLNFLLVLLNKQKTEESKTLKTALKKEIHCNFIDSDEEEEEDESEDEGINHKLQNINKILSKDMEKLYKKFEIDEYNGYSNEVR